MVSGLELRPFELVVVVIVAVVVVGVVLVADVVVVEVIPSNRTIFLSSSPNLFKNKVCLKKGSSSIMYS